MGPRWAFASCSRTTSPGPGVSAPRIGPPRVIAAGSSISATAEVRRHERDERGHEEGARQDGRALERRAALLEREAELLLDHGAEKHVRVPGDLAGDAARGGLAQSFALEHERDLGLGLARTLLDLRPL